MGSEAGVHADDAQGQRLERLDARSPLDLAERDLAVRAETNEVEDFLVDINADRNLQIGCPRRCPSRAGPWARRRSR
jgi:hypothetical protein